MVDGENTNIFPSKDSDYIVESIECNNGAIGIWDYNTWSINISNLNISKTTCSISFKSDLIKRLKEIINSTSNADTVDTLLVNDEDMNKIVTNEEAMKFIINYPILKETIKSSNNYTTAIAKKFLNSTVLSETEKYNAGLPCYVYKNGDNIFGGFVTKTTSTSTSTFGTETGSYYRVHAFGQGTNISVISNNKINTKEYNFIEMYSNHGASLAGLTGTNTLGFSEDQNVNSFTVSNSETYAATSTDTILNLDISNYEMESYLKINVKHGDQATNETAITNIYTIALY